MNHPIEAVIFDMDGTIVNTEPVHCSAWLEVLAKRGYHYDGHWFEQWIGKSDRILALGVIEEHGLSIEPRELQLEKEKLFHARVVNEAEEYPGTAAAMAALREKLPLAIATNSSYQDAKHVFQAIPLNQYVRALVTADDVKPRLKPKPDIYLLAAEKLGVNPAHCIAMEDSPAGAQAAASAGMYVIGLTHTKTKAELSAAHEWFDRQEDGMRRILELVGLFS